ncbi:MAG: hypothetical protein JXA74_07790 [Anaerolineae bacterium]|nr:hypothetical protein [Anaerolineae bacterium]
MRHQSVITWENGHVRAAVLQLGEGTAEMVGVSAAPVQGISRTTHPDVDRWHAGCEEALSQAEDMTPKLCGRKVVPDHVTMSLPAEITRSLPVTVAQQRRNGQRPVTLDEVRRLVLRSFRTAQDLLGAEASQGEDIVHGSVVATILDGRAVNDPLGLHGEELELRLCYHVAPLEWIRALETVAARMELVLICLVPQHVAYAASLRDPRALLLLLDEGHTTLSLVRGGRVEATALCEHGAREIIDAVGAVLNLRGRQAEALVRAFRADQLRSDFSLYVARTFWVELRRWMSALARDVLAMTRDEGVPLRIYCQDLSRRLPEALQALETPFWEQSLALGSCPEVEELNISLSRNVLDCTAQAADRGYLMLRALAGDVAQRHAQDMALERWLAEIVCSRRPPLSLRRSR